jgi:hypothetical protein
MTIPTYQADIDMPGNQIYLKFRDQQQPALFISAPKVESNVKNFALASDILRRNPRDEVAVNLADWLDGLAGKQ